MCAFVVLGLVFPYHTKRLASQAWRTSPKWRILCRVGRKTLAQSVVCNMVDKFNDIYCRDLQSATQRLELTEFEVKFTSPAIVSLQLPFTWLIKATVDQMIYHARQQRQHQLCCFSITILKRCFSCILYCWNFKPQKNVYVQSIFRCKDAGLALFWWPFLARLAPLNV